MPADEIPDRGERIRRGYDAFNTSDFDLALAGLHPDIVWKPLDLLPDTDTYHGHEGVVAFWRMWKETIGDFHVDVVETIEQGNCVVAVIQIRGKGRESAAEVVTPSFFHVWTFAGDQIVRAAMHATRQGADEELAMRAGEHT